ncbi:hypothetical protein IQ06DRAFT_118433 [Phaeosphaeriaceae sp. SRC1lsM3a]|nr:hypothetical protein IQ06DRAFT_118433 [Stagonospora sp. SRC1lsM3a]
MALHPAALPPFCLLSVIDDAVKTCSSSYPCGPPKAEGMHKTRGAMEGLARLHHAGASRNFVKDSVTDGVIAPVRRRKLPREQYKPARYMFCN